MNIVISGICFSVTAAMEYISRAFQRRSEDCQVKVVGPYPGLWMPWRRNGIDGVVMPEKYDYKPDIVLPFNGFGQTAPITYIEGLLGDFKPDLWLDVDAGFYLEGNPKNGVRALFMTDPHVLREYYNTHKHLYKYVFCPQRPYSQDNEYYLPYAADPEWHQPANTTKEKVYDVSLIGNFYQHRVDFMQQLKDQGKRTFFDLGLAKDDARDIYNQSIVGFNWSTLQDLNARIFELSALGIAPVFNRVPDLKLFDEGVEYLGFDTPEEANSQINILLNNPQMATQMGINARNKIIKDGHFWDNRAGTILEVCELTK